MSGASRSLCVLSLCAMTLGPLACGGGQDALNLQVPCLVAHPIVCETDEQAYLQIGGAFDQLRHDEGMGQVPTKMTKAIDRFVKQQMCAQRIAGLGLGIVWQGNLVYVKGYGLARGYETPSTQDDVPVRGQRTRFRWASLSKSVTALASVIATQDPDVSYDLDADLADHYRCANQSCDYVLPIFSYDNWDPNLQSDDWPIPKSVIPQVPLYALTPRKLLANRCGVMHYGDGDPNTPSEVPSEADRAAHDGFVWAVDYFTPKPLLYLPTTTYWYSSFGFNMAGAALDHAVPDSFWAYVQDKIVSRTQPVSMLYFHPDDTNDAQYGMAPWNTTQYRAYGYTIDANDDVVENTTPSDVSYKLPSGGFISTTADLALYAHGLLKNLFLDAAGTEDLWTPQANIVKGLPGNPTTGYALGFTAAQRSGERLVWHNGGQEDTATQMNLFPDGEDPAVGELGLVVMSNSEYLDRSAILNGVEDLLRHPYQGQDLVFEGTDPQNVDYTTMDELARHDPADGPYVDGGRYDDPEEDGYRDPTFGVVEHRYNPDYRWGPPVRSPELPRDDGPER